MPTTLTIRDKAATGEVVGESILELMTERITVRELIRSRVYQEVRDYNVKRTGNFRGLIQPTGAERTLNGYRMRKGRQIDWQRQYEAAVEAFEQNQVIIVVNDRQVEGLAEEIVVAPETEVSFLKIVPLAGG